ncbi:MAG: winged helix-turn-helix domain-containing protein [Bacteroidales bacterium]
MNKAETTLRNLEFSNQITLGTRDKSVVIDETVIRIMKAVDQKGSLNYALMLVGLSYRNGWGKIKKIEKELEIILIHSVRGGSVGGRSELSPAGKALILSYDKIRKEIDAVMHAHNKGR